MHKPFKTEKRKPDDLTKYCESGIQSILDIERDFSILSVKSQNGVNAVQRWSIENQKDAIAIKMSTKVIAPFWFSTEHHWTALTPFWPSADNLVFKRDIYFLPCTFSLTLTFNDIGCVHMGWNHVPKDISECDSALSWFERLILAHVNAKLFQIRLLKRILKCEKRAFWIGIRLESLILGHVNAKLFRNVIRACAFWKCALKPCISAWVNQRARTAQ